MSDHPPILDGVEDADLLPLFAQADGKVEDLAVVVSEGLVLLGTMIPRDGSNDLTGIAAIADAVRSGEIPPAEAGDLVSLLSITLVESINALRGAGTVKLPRHYLIEAYGEEKAELAADRASTYGAVVGSGGTEHEILGVQETLASLPREELEAVAFASVFAMANITRKFINITKEEQP